MWGVNCNSEFLQTYNMKLITNTIDEANENAEPCIKENFESETILDHNMKDLTPSVLKSEVVNGTTDSSCKDLKKLNGVVPPSNITKPISTNGFNSINDCEDISDGELTIIPSDEEDNLLADKDSPGNSCNTLVNSKVKKSVDLDSEKIVNGLKSDTSSSGCEENLKADKAEIPDRDSSNIDKEKNDNGDDPKSGSEKLETEVVKFDDIKEVTENVKDTIEICTTEEIEDNCPPVSSQENSNFIENDDGSDAENDREAKEKILTLLKETPPELVILPEEHSEFEKDLGSDTDEAMLSLLEDSQSDSNLNLLNDVIGSSSLTGFESNKKDFENVKIDDKKTVSEEDIADDCESTNKEISSNGSKCSTVDLKEQISSDKVKNMGISNECSDVKEISKVQVISEAGKVEVVPDSCSKNEKPITKSIEASEKCSEIQDTPIKNNEASEKSSDIKENSVETSETVEKDLNKKTNEKEQESIDENNSIVKETTSDEPHEPLNKATLDDGPEEIRPLKGNVSTEESSLEISNNNADDEIVESTEITSCSSIKPDCNNKKELSGVKSPCLKRNLEIELKPENAKKLIRSTSFDENSQKNIRKRSLSVDNQLNNVNGDIKRFRKSIPNDLSDKLECKEEEKDLLCSSSDSDVKLENSAHDKEVKENEIISCELSCSDKSVTSISDKNSIESSFVNSECDVKPMDICESETEKETAKTVADGKKIVEKKEEIVEDGEKPLEMSTKTVQDIKEIIEKREKTVEDSEKIVDKSEKTIEKCEKSLSQKNLIKSDEVLPNETKIDDSVPSSKDDAKSNVSSERVAHGSWKNITKDLSLITKIHKERFKSLNRWDLEELIVQKICESIADRSVIGELRQRVKSLENAIDNWRKKTAVIEKSNREIRTVLNRYLKEVDDNIADKSKPLIPIRITRSVGLQVAPPANLDKLRGMGRLQSQRRPDNIRTLRPNSTAVTANSNVVVKPPPPTTVQQRTPTVATRIIAPKTPIKQQQVLTNSQKIIRNNNISPAGTGRRVPQINANNDVINSPTGAILQGKRIVSAPPIVTATATAPSPSISSDLEVIDLTDKEERNIARGVVAASNVQILPRSAANTIGISTAAVGQQMTLVVPTSAVQAVRGNQRQQLIFTTTTTNGTTQIRPVTSATVVTNRPTTSSQTLSIPGAVVMKNGTFVPITSQAPANVVVRSANPTIVSRNVQQLRLSSPVAIQPAQPLSHPAPLPPVTSEICWTLPKPVLKVSKTSNGIMLSWSMTLTKNHDEIASYQLYAYQESNNIPPNSNLWKKVGDVKALPLPMACTLTQFINGHKYHFAVRAVDVFSRVSQFSLPSTILLQSN